MAEQSDKIYILTIDHRHGTNTYACESEEVAYEVLDKYVQEWWKDEAKGTEHEDNMPEDKDDRIDTYFEELCPGEESYDLDDSKIYRKDDLDDD